MDTFIAISQILLAATVLPAYMLVAMADGFASLLPRQKWKPKTILITGAASGIGEGLAVRYAAPSTTLALVARNPARLTPVAEKCRALGATVLEGVYDVTDEKGLREWILKVDAQVGGLDLVVANAGVSEGTLGLDVETQPEECARRVFESNVTGTFNTIYPALPAMRTRRRGQIAIVSSLASYTPARGAYPASKIATRTLGTALRAQLACEGVGVTVVLPGYVKTPMTDRNKFSMEFMVGMEYAVDRIVKGLEEDRATVAFPWQVPILLWALQVMPPAVHDFLARNRLMGEHLSYK